MISAQKEAAITALMTCQTKKEAAAQAGVDESTLRRWLKDEKFKERYAEECRAMVSQATRELQKSFPVAIRALCDVAGDQEENAQTRVSASRSILEFGLRCTELTDVMTVIGIVKA